MKLKKIITVGVLSLSILSLNSSVFANTISNNPLKLSTLKTNQGIMEGFMLYEQDIDYLLQHGSYSNSGKFVTYKDNTFSVESLIKGKESLIEDQESKNNHRSKRGILGGPKFEYKHSGLFYSRGRQHRLGAITLNPGQSGSISKGASFSYEVQTSGGVSAEVFEASIGHSYATEYTVTTTHDLENKSSKTVTYILSSVFEVHDYNIINTGILGNNHDFIGTAQYYEPFSAYIYEYED